MKSWVAFFLVAVVLIGLTFLVHWVGPDFINTRVYQKSSSEVAEEVPDGAASTESVQPQAKCESVHGETGTLTYDEKSEKYRCAFSDMEYCDIPKSGLAAEAVCSYQPTQHPGWVKDISPDAISHP